MDGSAFASAMMFVGVPVLAGHAALTWLARDQAQAPVAEWLSLSFGVGLSLWGLYATAGYLTMLPLASSLAGFVLLSVLAIGAAALAGRIALPSLPPLDFRKRPLAAATVLCGGAIALDMWVAGPYQVLGSDTFDHLAIIRKLIGLGHLGNRVAILSDTVPLDEIAAAYSFSPTHALYAACSAVLGAEPARVWLWMPALLTPVLLAGIYGVAVRLFGRGARAVLTVSVFVLILWAGLFPLSLAELPYPRLLGFLAFLSLFALLHDLVIDRAATTASVTKIAVLAAGLSAVQLQWSFLFAFTVGGLGLSCWTLRRWRQGTVLLALAVAATLLSVLVFLPRWPFYAAIAAEMKELFAARFESTSYHLFGLKGLFPARSTFRYWLAAIPALVVILRYRRTGSASDEKLYHLGLLTIVIYVFVGNPFTATAVSKLASQDTLRRLFYITSTLMIWTGAAMLPRRNSAAGTGAALPRVAACAAMALLVVGTGAGLSLGDQLARVPPDLVQYLTAEWGIGQDALRWIASHGRLIAFAIGSLVLAAVFGVGILLSGGVPDRPRPASALVPLLCTALLLLLPARLKAPESAWFRGLYDDFMGWRGVPTVRGILRHPQYSVLFGAMAPGSRVLSDVPHLAVAFRDVCLANPMYDLMRKARQVNRDIEPLFTPPLDPQRARTILARYRPDYVLLSPKVPGAVAGVLDREPELRLAVRFRNPDGIGDFRLYRVRIDGTERGGRREGCGSTAGDSPGPLDRTTQPSPLLPPGGATERRRSRFDEMEVLPPS